MAADVDNDGAIIVGAISIGLLIAYVWLSKGVAAVVAPFTSIHDFFTRGDQLSTSHYDANSNVTDDVNDLLSQAGAVLVRVPDLDTYAAARMIRNEADQKIAATSADAKILRLHVLINDANALGYSLYDTVTAGKGNFGKQAGRRYSSLLDPYENDYAIAETVIAERAAGGEDLANGATKFVNTRGRFEVPQAWLDEGYHVVDVGNNPEADLVLLGKV